MGQLERYGLYVLCLVIFLILGVAIWGGDPAQAGPVVESATLTEPAPTTLDAGTTGDEFFERAAPVQVVQPELGLETVAAGNPEPDAPRIDKPTPPVAGPKESEDRTATGYREYKIKDGDSFERIARRELGSPRHVQAIRELNPGIEEKKMPLGKVLRLPVVAVNGKAKTNSAGASGETYTVLDGDNPWTISYKLFKTSKYADEIMALNGIRDPKKIKVGSILKLPARQ